MLSSSASISRHSLLTGLSRMFALVFTKTLRTRPFDPDRGYTTMPSCQEFLGAVSSTITTRSLVVKFLLGLFHLIFSCMKVKYSFIHLCQKRSDMYCTCLHLRWEYKFPFWKTPGGMTGFDFNWRRWFGVRGSRSFGSQVTVVMDRSFTIASTSHSPVWRASSSKRCSFRTE